MNTKIKFSTSEERRKIIELIVTAILLSLLINIFSSILLNFFNAELMLIVSFFLMILTLLYLILQSPLFSIKMEETIPLWIFYNYKEHYVPIFDRYENFFLININNSLENLIKNTDYKNLFEKDSLKPLNDLTQFLILKWFFGNHKIWWGTKERFTLPTPIQTYYGTSIKDYKLITIEDVFHNIDNIFINYYLDKLPIKENEFFRNDEFKGPPNIIFTSKNNNDTFSIVIKNEYIKFQIEGYFDFVLENSLSLFLFPVKKELLYKDSWLKKIEKDYITYTIAINIKVSFSKKYIFSKKLDDYVEWSKNLILELAYDTGWIMNVDWNNITINSFQKIISSS